MVIRVPDRLRALLAVVAAAAVGLTATGTHVVLRGETLGEIARQHGSSVSAIAEANHLADPDLIRAGATLSIPSTGGAGTGATTYVVRAGDTLGTIARRHGTSVSAIMSRNHISDPDLIIIGRTLTIPGTSADGTVAPTPPGSSPQRPGQRHTVRPGETLGSIAAAHGVSVRDLAAWNGIVDGRIYAGTRLLLADPGSLPSAGTGSGDRIHHVRSGESLVVIAGRYGTTIGAIASANGLADPDRIRIGQQLRIPGGDGSITCVVPGATFFNDWGFPRSGGRSHEGNDLFAPRGTPVRAPVGGTVSRRTGSLGGRQVRLTDGSGGAWSVSHLDAFGAAGSVSAGEVIGFVGDSGNARGSRPHAHVEYRAPNGNAVNPYPLLRQIC